MIGADAAKLRDAMTSSEPPMVIVLPTEGLTTANAEKLLKDSGLWYLK